MHPHSHKQILPRMDFPFSLYVSIGLPEVFCCLEHSSTCPPSESWLYVPRQHVEDIQKGVSPPAEGTSAWVGKSPLSSDEIRAYPLFLNGKVKAFLREKPGGQFSLSPETEQNLTEYVSSLVSSEDEPPLELAMRFISTLYRQDANFEIFMKHFLDLLAGYHPHSIATLYRSQNGIYTQQLVVGNLLLFDKLSVELNHATAEEWLGAVERGDYFHPIDLLPGHPTFLAEPPNYLFVYKGPHSERTDYLVAVVFPGDIDTRKMHCLQTTAQLTAALHDTQFSYAYDILSLFMRLDDPQCLSSSMEQILKKVFALASRYSLVNRLSVVFPSGASYAIVQKHQTDIHVRKEGSPIAEAFIRRLSQRQTPLLIPTLEEQSLTDEEIKQYYLDNVKSELCFPFRTSEEQVGIVAFGAPREGDYLSTVEPFLKNITAFISLWYKLAQPVSTSMTTR